MLEIPENTWISYVVLLQHKLFFSIYNQIIETIFLKKDLFSGKSLSKLTFKQKG